MHTYRFGLEEEYFVVDRRTGRVRPELDPEFMRAIKRRLGAQIMHEMLQCQIEAVTPPFSSVEEATAELLRIRSAISETARQHRLGIIAAGTHPLLRPAAQQVTAKRRYLDVAKDLGYAGFATPLCGLHVHVEVPRPEARMELVGQLLPYLPIFLALSTSSPFWAGSRTGLVGYRNAAHNVSPRAGLPEALHDAAEYNRYVDVLSNAGFIEDASHIWWAVRPSLRHPTVELRIMDSCTSVDDAVAIASLFRALVRHFSEAPEMDPPPTGLDRAFATENVWRAQRFGIDGTYIDPDSLTPVAFEDWLKTVMARLDQDVEALGIHDQMDHLAMLLGSGTSAHRQLDIFDDQDPGLPFARRLGRVCKWLMKTTERGRYHPSPGQARNPRLTEGRAQPPT